MDRKAIRSATRLRAASNILEEIVNERTPANLTIEGLLGAITILRLTALDIEKRDPRAGLYNPEKTK